MTLTIAEPGIANTTAYTIKFYSHDSHHGGTGGTVTYAGASGTTGSASITYNTTGNNLLGFADTQSATSSWTSNSSGQIVIDVTGTNEGSRVSGMEITIIPEPSCAAAAKNSNSKL